MSDLSLNQLMDSLVGSIDDYSEGADSYESRLAEDKKAKDIVALKNVIEAKAKDDEAKAKDLKAASEIIRAKSSEGLNKSSRSVRSKSLSNNLPKKKSRLRTSQQEVEGSKIKSGKSHSKFNLLKTAGGLKSGRSVTSIKKSSEKLRKRTSKRKTKVKRRASFKTESEENLDEKYKIPANSATGLAKAFEDGVDEDLHHDEFDPYAYNNDVSFHAKIDLEGDKGVTEEEEPEPRQDLVIDDMKDHSTSNYIIYTTSGESVTDYTLYQPVDFEPQHICGCTEKIHEEVEPTASDILYDSLVNHQLYQSKDSDSEITTTDEQEIFAKKKFSPFELVWGFGANLHIPILNLTDDNRKMFFMVCCHKGVFYDYKAGVMFQMEGHSNPINSAAVDSTGRWLATSDVGANSRMVITDTFKNNVVRTIYNEPNESALLIALSPDAKFLITISKPENPRIDLWFWTLGEEEANDSYLCHAKRIIGSPKQIAFHPNDSRHIMIAFEKQIIFMKIDEENRKFFPAVLPKLKITGGTITGCSFAERCHECFATTTEGYIMIFSKTTYSETFGQNKMDTHRKCIKLIKVSSAITCIVNVDDMLVCTNSYGGVGYYNKHLKLLFYTTPNKKVPFVKYVSFQRTQRKYKFEDAFNFDNQFFQIGDIQHIIEKHEDLEEQYETLYANLVPSVMTVTHTPFVIRTFIAASGDGNIFFVDATKQLYRPLFSPCESSVVAIDCSDENLHLVVAYRNGRVTVFNYMTHEILSTNIIEQSDQAIATCIKFSPQTLHLCMGTSDGTLLALNTVLQPMYRITICPLYAIKKLCYSHDGRYLALYNNCKTVFMFKFTSRQWTCVGKQRSHYKGINDIMFIDTDPMKLYTIGDDRYLVEYNVAQGEEEMTILTRIRIEQSASPLCFLNYQSIDTNKRYILIANDQQKYSIYHEETKLCRSIVLGPSHGCYGKVPLKKIANLPGSLGKYIIFAADNCMGIQMLPPDGNPYKYIGLIGPTISDFAITGSGEYIFTFGINDQSVIMQKIHTECVPILQKFGGTELAPYYCLIEGGEHGWYFKEMQDLFCYMQILQQGDFYNEQKFGEYISIDEVPDLMRSCGFYPTEFQISNIMNDVKYRDFDKTGVLQTMINFIEFVKLFINHRPAYGVNMDQLKVHFNALLPKAELHELTYFPRNSNKATIIGELCTRGEAFKEASLNNCFKILMGNVQKDRAAYNYSATQLIPDEFDFDYFVKHILGIIQDSNYEEMQTRKQSQ